MAMAAALSFFDQLAEDEALAAELGELRDDPAAVYAAVTAKGFDATPEEFKVAFLTRFGSELSSEQLDGIAGGVSDDWLLSFSIGMGATFGAVLVGVAAAVAVG